MGHPELGGGRVIVFGASRGIGEQAAYALTHALPESDVLTYGFEPVDIALTYLKHQDRADKVAERIREGGRSAQVVQMDIMSRSSIKKAVGALEDLAPFRGAAFNIAAGLEDGGGNPVLSEGVNHYGQVALLDELAPYLEDEAVIAYSQSDWGHLHGQVHPPPIGGGRYGEDVAGPKKRGENALRDRISGKFSDRGFAFKVVTGGIVDDTPVGRRATRNAPEWTAKQNEIGNVIKAKGMGIIIAQTIMKPGEEPVVSVGASLNRLFELDGMEEYPDPDFKIVEGE